MLSKKYLKLSKGDIFVLILLLILVLFLVLAVKTDKSGFFVFGAYVPLSSKGGITAVLWRNFHKIAVSFVFFGYMALALEDGETDLAQPFAVMLGFFILLALVFSVKFGFVFFGKSFLSVFSLLFSIYAFLLFFEVAVKSRVVGALVLVLVNAFSGLLTYLFNFKYFFKGAIEHVVSALYYALPFYGKFGLTNVDYKHLIFPVILLLASYFLKFVLTRRNGEN